MQQNLPEAVRDLLAAIVEALDVPLADRADDSLAAYALLRRRADEARIVAASVLPGVDADYIAGAAKQLRDWTAESPVTYPTWRNHLDDEDGMCPACDTTSIERCTACVRPAPQPAGEDQCGRCKRPFDPTDTRFDGHARHRDTAWCRRCVDNCHDGGTEHACQICSPKRYGGEDQ